MKISKKDNKAVVANSVLVQQIDEQSNSNNSAEFSANKYGEAICHIMSAIESLGKFGKTDEVAKDSIANLSVVLLDLQ